MNFLILKKGKENAEKKSEQEETEALLQWFQAGSHRGVEAESDSQADGFAESGAPDGITGQEAAQGGFDVSGGKSNRDAHEQVGARGVFDVPFGETAKAAEHLSLLNLARQFLASPADSGPFAPATLDPEGYELGAIQAVADVTGVLKEIIEFSAPPSRSRSIALTKLDECNMWVNRAISKGE